MNEFQRTSRICRFVGHVWVTPLDEFLPDRRIQASRCSSSHARASAIDACGRCAGAGEGAISGRREADPASVPLALTLRWSDGRSGQATCDLRRAARRTRAPRRRDHRRHAGDAPSASVAARARIVAARNGPWRPVRSRQGRPRRVGPPRRARASPARGCPGARPCRLAPRPDAGASGRSSLRARARLGVRGAGAVDGRRRPRGEAAHLRARARRARVASSIRSRGRSRPSAWRERAGSSSGPGTTTRRCASTRSPRSSSSSPVSGRSRPAPAHPRITPSSSRKPIRRRSRSRWNVSAPVSSSVRSRVEALGA